ncbi:hypothetical protein EV182_004151 [Spiromyces aspiralis]|uniref:Uncharacterized protein n=1 Tax=Spiromyces aspiralis TaxID=68401 RepID=A0ACC1HF90_9FUNG|nr:hypothetical protein EV182_004151 [Spiromyces aspiralis]
MLPPPRSVVDKPVKRSAMKLEVVNLEAELVNSEGDHDHYQQQCQDPQLEKAEQSAAKDADSQYETGRSGTKSSNLNDNSDREDTLPGPIDQLRQLSLHTKGQSYDILSLKRPRSRLYRRSESSSSTAELTSSLSLSLSPEDTVRSTSPPQCDMYDIMTAPLKTPQLEEINAKCGEMRLSSQVILVNTGDEFKPMFQFVDEHGSDCWLYAIQLNPLSGKLKVILDVLKGEAKVDVDQHQYCNEHFGKLRKVLGMLASICRLDISVKVILATASKQEKLGQQLARRMEDVMQELEQKPRVAEGWDGLCPFCRELPVDKDGVGCLNVILMALQKYIGKNPAFRQPLAGLGMDEYDDGGLPSARSVQFDDGDISSGSCDRFDWDGDTTL